MNTNTFTKMKKFIIMAAILPMSLFAQGNVGINTLTPQARLDVDGTGVTNVLRLQNLPFKGSAAPFKMMVIDPTIGNGFVGYADMPISSVCSTFPLIGNGTAGSCLTFQPGTAPNQTWLWDGTNWTLGSTTVTTASPLQGDGVTTPITFLPGTAANQNQTWYWDGTNWVLGTTNTAFPNQGNGSAANPITFVPGTAQDDAFLWNATTNAWEIRQLTKWDLLGNAGTDPNINFLGTTDAQDLVFRTNNIEQVRTLASNGFVGIGTPTPIAKLHVNEGAIYAINASPLLYPGSGTFPDVPSGPGTRFMWIPEKSAIRFGTVNVEGPNAGDDWDPAKIGDFSSANGYNAEASGVFSFAVGNNVKATGEGSTALGKFVNTTHNGSYQIGDSPNNNTQPGSILNSSFANQFSARFNGGYRFFTTVTQDVDKAVYIESGNSSNPNAGSIGIGIASPTQKLHVNGNAIFTALAGTGLRMVTADANGKLGVTPINNYLPGTGIDISTVGNNVTISTLPLGGDLIGTDRKSVV